MNINTLKRILLGVSKILLLSIIYYSIFSYHYCGRLEFPVYLLGSKQSDLNLYINLAPSRKKESRYLHGQLEILHWCLNSMPRPSSPFSKVQFILLRNLQYNQWLRTLCSKIMKRRPYFGSKNFRFFLCCYRMESLRTVGGFYFSCPPSPLEVH